MKKGMLGQGQDLDLQSYRGGALAGPLGTSPFHSGGPGTSLLAKRIGQQLDSKSPQVSPMNGNFGERNGSSLENKQAIQSAKAFIVKHNAQKPIPLKWSKDRLDGLIQRPKHKPQREKSQLLPPHLRNNSPMTMEDKQYRHTDLDLRTTLRNGFREISGSQTASNFNKTGGMSKLGQQQQLKSTLTQTIPIPPSFYDDDMEKWKNKFNKQIQDRAEFKKMFYNTLDLTPITKNTNVTDQSTIYGGGNSTQEIKVQVQANNNQTAKPDDDMNQSFIYKRVMQRRRSRQSTWAPTNLDIDYAGDSAKFYHLIKTKNSDQGSPNKSQLDFGMKLRCYRNDTSFKGSSPWQYPQKKIFQPKEIFKHHKDRLNQTLGDFKLKYNDNFPEKNQFFTREMIDKHIGMMQNSFWEFSLRTERNNNKKRNGQRELSMDQKAKQLRS